MSLVYSLRRAFDRGEPVGAAKTHLSVRGLPEVGEQHDSFFRRVVKTATFQCLDGTDEPVPLMRNVDLLKWTASHVVLTGVEDVADDRSMRPKLYAQTWQMVPEPLEELGRKERQISRLVFALRRQGTAVEFFPDGGMRIQGEIREDGQPVVGRWG